MVRDDMKISSMTTECRRRNREEMERKGNNGGITQKRQGKPNHWEALHGRHCMGGTGRFGLVVKATGNGAEGLRFESLPDHGGVSFGKTFTTHFRLIVSYK